MVGKVGHRGFWNRGTLCISSTSQSEGAQHTCPVTVRYRHTPLNTSQDISLLSKTSIYGRKLAFTPNGPGYVIQALKTLRRDFEELSIHS